MDKYGQASLTGYSWLQATPYRLACEIYCYSYMTAWPFKIEAKLAGSANVIAKPFRWSCSIYAGVAILKATPFKWESKLTANAIVIANAFRWSSHMYSSANLKAQPNIVGCELICASNLTAWPLVVETELPVSFTACLMYCDSFMSTTAKPEPSAILSGNSRLEVLEDSVHRYPSIKLSGNAIVRVDNKSIAYIPFGTRLEIQLRT